SLRCCDIAPVSADVDARYAALLVGLRDLSGVTECSDENRSCSRSSKAPTRRTRARTVVHGESCRFINSGLPWPSLCFLCVPPCLVLCGAVAYAARSHRTTSGSVGRLPYISADARKIFAAARKTR